MIKFKEKTIAIYVWIFLCFWFVYGIISLAVIAYDISRTNAILKRKINTKNQIIEYLEDEIKQCNCDHLNIN